MLPCTREMGNFTMGLNESCHEEGKSILYKDGVMHGKAIQQSKIYQNTYAESP